MSLVIVLLAVSLGSQTRLANQRLVCGVNYSFVADGDWCLVLISDKIVVISIVIDVNHHLVVGLPLVVEIGVHVLQDPVRDQLLVHARARVIELLLELVEFW